jgi:hypothetical protein
LPLSWWFLHGVRRDWKVVKAAMQSRETCTSQNGT